MEVSNDTKAIGNSQATGNYQVAIAVGIIQAKKSTGTQQAVGKLGDRTDKVHLTDCLPVIDKAANIIATKAKLTAAFASLTIDKFGAGSIQQGSDITADIKVIFILTAIAGKLAVKNFNSAKIRDTNIVAAAVVISTKKIFAGFNIRYFEKVCSLNFTCMSNFDSKEPIYSLIDTTRSLDSTVLLAAILQNQ